MDKRIQNTKKSLTTALFILADQKNVSDITVTELCRQAQVNRSTFYKYYQVPSDILDELMTEAYREVMSQFINVPLNKVSSSFVMARLTKGFQWLYQHQNVLDYLLSNHYLGQNYIPQMFPDLNNSDTKHLVDFYFDFGGVGSLLLLWRKQGCTWAPEEVAAMVLERIQKVRQP